jgi:hypothetical protein
VPQPDDLTVVAAKHRFEAPGLLIRLSCLPTYEQERLVGLELSPLEYLHGNFENLSPPWMEVMCGRMASGLRRRTPGPWKPGAATPWTG